MIDNRQYFAITPSGERVELDGDKQYLPGQIDRMFKVAGFDNIGPGCWQVKSEDAK